MPIIRTFELATRGALTLAGVRSRWVATTHGAIHCYQGAGRGQLPSVVCLHGLASSAFSFGRTLLRLQSFVGGVAAPDLPGHGRSPIPRERFGTTLLIQSVTESLLALSETPILLAGNSLGGALALRFALTHPDRVRGVVVCSPAGAALSDIEFRRVLQSFRLETVQDGKAFFERLYHRPPPFQSLLAWDLRRVLRRPHLRELISALDEADPFSPEELAELKVPLLVLWGTSDGLMPESARSYFEAHLPATGRIERLDNVGHSPQIEDPDALARYILAFARSVSAPSPTSAIGADQTGVP